MRRGTTIDGADMTPVAQAEVKTFLRAVNSLEPRRVGADVGGWFEQVDGRSVVDFRIPYADFKHPSSIEVNAEADAPADVFMTGKYQTVRFAPIGSRDVREDELRRQFPDAGDEVSLYNLHDRYQDEVIAERTAAFERAIDKVVQSYPGISGRVDTGDAAFSAGEHRPHVRLYCLDVGGATLGRFVTECVEAVEKQVYNQFHIRGV